MGLRSAPSSQRLILSVLPLPKVTSWSDMAAGAPSQPTLYLLKLTHLCLGLCRDLPLSLRNAKPGFSMPEYPSSPRGAAHPKVPQHGGSGRSRFRRDPSPDGGPPRTFPRVTLSRFPQQELGATRRVLRANGNEPSVLLGGGGRLSRHASMFLPPRPGAHAHCSRSVPRAAHARSSRPAPGAHAHWAE